MVRKIPLILLVLYGVLFWQTGARCSANTIQQADRHRAEKEYLQAEAIYKKIISESNDIDYALAAQKRLTILYIETKDELRAKAAFQELVTRFAGHEGVPGAVFELGEEYREVKKYDRAREVYQYVVDHWPQAGHAIEAQVVVTQLSIRLKDEGAAQRGYDDLLAKFAGNEQLAKAVDHVADEYRRADNYKKARAIYQYIVKTWPEGERAMESQRGMVLADIRLGDDANAASDIDKLIANFGQNEGIAKAVRQVADEYCEAAKYEKALQIYEDALGRWPQAEDAVESQKGIVLANALAGDEATARAGLDELIGKFGGSKDAEEVVYDIGNECRELERNKLALAVYEKVVENWPETDEAIDSQTNAAKLYISIRDDPNAEAAIGKLLTDFGEHNLIIRAIDDVAKGWGDMGRHEKAAELYGYIVRQWPGSDDALWAQMRLVMSRIRAWDLDGAEVELGVLLVEFADNERLDDAVHEIVEEYRNTGAHEESRELFNYLLQEWAASGETMLELQVGVALQSIRLAELDKADAAVVKLIADFNDNPKLAKGLFQIGEEYYNEAFSRENEGLESESKDYFREAIAVWERIITGLPESGTTTRAFFFSAQCYRRLGKYPKAIEYYREIVAKWPAYQYAGTAQYLIGYSYKKMKQAGTVSASIADAEIQAAYERVIENYPDCPSMKAVRSWLDFYSKQD